MLPVMKTYSNGWMPSLFDELFESSFPTMHRVHTTSPAINVTESDKAYDVALAVPGMTKEMANVQLTEDGNLMVKIETKKHDEQKSDDGKRWLRREWGYSSYSQSFSLPDDVERESIQASVSDGVLHIELPKKAAEALPSSRQIEVK